MFEEQSIKTEKLPFDSKSNNEAFDSISKGLQEAKEDLENELKVKDHGYIKISNLCSEGKLSAPKTFHIRDVNIEDLLELSEEDEIAQQEAVIRVMENMIKEGVDVSQFSEQEVIQTLLTVYANFHSTLMEYPYILDEEEENLIKATNPKIYEKYKEGVQKYTVEVKIEDLEFKELPKEFKEPIRLTDKSGFEIAFRLPRMGDIITIQKYIKKKYSKQENELAVLSDRLQEEQSSGKRDVSISLEMRETYQEYLKTKGKDYVKSLLALLLISIGKKKLNTIEEKVNAIPKIPVSLWQDFNDILGNQLDYGVQEEVKVTSPITGKSTTRRYSFRPMEVLSNFTKKKPNETTISFG